MTMGVELRMQKDISSEMSLGAPQVKIVSVHVDVS
jgi:hypothetical protein